MEQAVIGKAIEYGVFVILFVSLLFWVLKENAKREHELRSIMDKIADCYKTISMDTNKITHEVKAKQDILLSDVVRLDNRVTVIDSKVDKLHDKVDAIKYKQV